MYIVFVIVLFTGINRTKLNKYEVEVILMGHLVLNGLDTKHSNVVIILYLFNFVQLMSAESNKTIT